MFPTTVVFFVLLHSIFPKVHAINACIDTKKVDLGNIIESEKVSNIFLLCPFKATSSRAININRSHITIVCMKENASDVCQFKSKRRHLNLYGDGVTVIGFDFMDSENGAVNIVGRGSSFIDCTFKS